MMTQTLRGLAVALTTAAAMACGSALALDENCIDRINDIAGKERQRVNVYSGEIKNMKDDPWAPNSESICSSALSRAEQYLKRHQSNKTICEIGSSYVDNQAVQLFRNASSTCRQQLEERVRRMSPDDQRILTQRLDENLSGIR